LRRTERVDDGRVRDRGVMQAQKKEILITDNTGKAEPENRD
jgi:hypothetical protein